MVTYTGGTSHTEYGFTGEQYGDSTQLLYLRARFYNPTDFTPDQKLAYEFGVVTDYTRNNFPELMAALRRSDTGRNIDQVLWHSEDRIAFVVSEAQLRELCRGGSCVAEDLDN